MGGGELSFVFTSTVWPMCISLFNYNFFTSGTAFSPVVSVYFVPSSPFYGNVLHRFLLLPFTCLSRFELNFFLMREVLISQNILLRARLCKIIFHHPKTTTTTFLSNMFRMCCTLSGFPLLLGSCGTHRQFCRAEGIYCKGSWFCLRLPASIGLQLFQWNPR